MGKFKFFLSVAGMVFLLGSVVSAVPAEAEPESSGRAQIHHRRDLKVDFTVDHIRVDPATNHLVLSIRNTTGVRFRGDVGVRIRTRGAVTTTNNRSYEFVFEGNPTWLIDIPELRVLSGNYEISVYLDHANRIVEANEENNWFKQNVIFGSPGANDLAITDFSRPPGNHRIFYTVENKANNEFRGDLILSVHNNNVRKSDVTHRNVVLQQGQSFRYELSTPLNPGRNILRLKVDPGNRVAESNEGNNTRQGEFYPYVQDISLVEYLTMGQGSSVVIATRSHPRLVLRPRLLREIGGANWGVEVTTKVRGNGARAFSGYRILLWANFNGARRAEKAYELRNGPRNGATKDDKLDFFLPKRYCRNGQKGFLVVNLIVNGRNHGVWRVNLEFAGF